MAESIIAHDKDLPEIPGRCPWEKPTSFLVKDPAAPNGWREDTSGRRPSTLLLIQKLRAAVDHWRDQGYPGASDVTRRLFAYWFDEDHEVTGFSVPFRYHFCQREAIETLVYVVEVARNQDAKDLVDTYASVFQKDLLSKSVEFQTTMDGRRQIRRYVPELDAEGVQELPPENLRRYAFKMATGSGKTWVMAMAVVWSHFHKQRVPGSNLSTNFLIVAPNVIVYQRLEKDFASLGTTEQGESGTPFRIDYLKPSGAIGFYYPDWVAVQATGQGEVNWIIETKGRVWEGTDAKDAAMRDWCVRISQQTGERWEYARVNQSAFEARKSSTLEDAINYAKCFQAP